MVSSFRHPEETTECPASSVHLQCICSHFGRWKCCHMGWQQSRRKFHRSEKTLEATWLLWMSQPATEHSSLSVCVWKHLETRRFGFVVFFGSGGRSTMTSRLPTKILVIRWWYWDWSSQRTCKFVMVKLCSFVRFPCFGQAVASNSHETSTFRMNFRCSSDRFSTHGRCIHDQFPINFRCRVDLLSIQFRLFFD